MTSGENCRLRSRVVLSSLPAMTFSLEARTARRIGVITTTSAVRSIELPKSRPASSSTDRVRANRDVSSLRQSTPKTGIHSTARSMIALPAGLRYSHIRMKGDPTRSSGKSHQPMNWTNWLNPIRARLAQGRLDFRPKSLRIPANIGSRKIEIRMPTVPASIKTMVG